MTFATDVARVNRKFKVIEREISGVAEDDRLLKIGWSAAVIADEQVGSDLGMVGFRHWRRGKIIPITTIAALTGRQLVRISPAIPARGPMRVLSEGRESHAAGDYRVVGQRFSKKQGVMVAKRRKVKVTSGATTGHDTWNKADRKMRRFVATTHTRDVVGVIQRVMR